MFSTFNKHEMNFENEITLRSNKIKIKSISNREDFPKKTE